MTDTLWSTHWAPSGEGTHILEAEVSDWTGETAITALPIILDLSPPSVAITDLLINQADAVTYNRYDLTGTASDEGGIASVAVSVDGGPWEPTSLEPAGDGAVNWRYPWVLSSPVETSFSVTTRATDVAGRTSTDTQIVMVDITPPEPVHVSLAYQDTSGVTHSLEPGQTLLDADLLSISWTASSDGAGLGEYLAGWTNNPVPDAGGPRRVEWDVL